jgi:2-keto-4-pentenoate hydratase/2-oxohepta-3-ene-1,7-dioic acid hydratase in catechol pathway
MEALAPPRLERWSVDDVVRAVLCWRGQRRALASAGARWPLDLFERGDLAPGALERLFERATPIELGERARLLVPVDPQQVGKILALGKNFREHAQEFGEAVPEEPLFFNKLSETLVPGGATVRVREWYRGRVDHEAELAVCLGRRACDVPAERALEHVLGYSVANDLTARSLQGQDRQNKHPWFRAKNMDGFCPLGPALVPAAFLDPSALELRCRVRARATGEWSLRQAAHTRDMVVDVAQAIAWLSRHLTLQPLDWILMGTPAGVGPLEDGDLVECAIEPIGSLRTNLVRASSPLPAPGSRP